VTQALTAQEPMTYTQAQRLSSRSVPHLAQPVDMVHPRLLLLQGNVFCVQQAHTVTSQASSLRVAFAMLVSSAELETTDLAPMLPYTTVL
jgi:hypothetical protein